MRKDEQVLREKKEREKKKVNQCPKAGEIKKRGLEVSQKLKMDYWVMKSEGEKTLPAKVHFTSTDFGRNPSVCEEEEEEEGKEPAPVSGAEALGRLYM